MNDGEEMNLGIEWSGMEWYGVEFDGNSEGGLINMLGLAGVKGRNTMLWPLHSTLLHSPPLDFTLNHH